VSLKAIAEAPCKVIITGEHFVVHGGVALAAAVDRKVRVDVGESGSLRVRSEGLGNRSGPSLRPFASVLAVMSRVYGTPSRLDIGVSSDIPSGAGLGSSAATMVALAAAVSELEGLSLGVPQIVEMAMAGERDLHGRPSGIDPNVCASGGVIRYRLGEGPSKVELQGTRSFIVAVSKQRRSTRRLVSKVSEMGGRYPSLFAALAEAATDVSSLAEERLVHGDMEGLGRLMTYNHAVLSAAGASNQVLDSLVNLLVSLGCPGAKLTGAGGGGSVLAVAPRGKEKSTIADLKRRGIEAFEAKIPVAGVKSWLSR
jgi:mevalonate kinase